MKNSIMKNLISVFLSIFFLSSTYYSFFVFEQKVDKALEIQLSIEELKRDQSLFSEEITRTMSLIEESLKKIQDSDAEFIISTPDSNYACAALACIFVIFATCLVTGYFVYAAHSFSINISPLFNAIKYSSKTATFDQEAYKDIVSTLSEKVNTLYDYDTKITSYGPIFKANYERISIVTENLRTCNLKIAELETKLDFILLDPNILGSNLEEAANALYYLKDII